MPMINALRAANFNADALAPALAPQVFLIAIRGEPRAPIQHRGHPLHPMQIIVTGMGDMPPLAGPDAAIGPLPLLPAPYGPMRATHPQGALMPREITGEILRDANGRLYEKVGDYVRPVNQLFTGSRGEMIDMSPVRDVTREAGGGHRPRPGARPAAEEADDAPPMGGEDYAEDQSVAAAARAARDGARHRPFRELVNRLTPEPGLWRLVRYADFIDVITPQLADPRRLQPGHQLACYAQIYELAVTLPLPALEDAAASELGNAGKLLPLSYDLCRRFSLSLPRPALALAAARQAARHAHVPGIVPVGARFLTLRVALDPTAENATTPPQQAMAPAPELSAAAAPSATPAMAATAGPGQKSAIPEEFVKPWDMRLSRDEALYDMTLATSRGGLARLYFRWKDAISSRDMKKWHALLSGKSPDEQLWAIKPPRGALADKRIRRWAEQTLQLGGYDPARMVVEWEIHWRRKGL